VGVALQRRRHTATRQRLPKPVISIGGLAMGGTGKTPLVLWLARELHERGVHVGMLTRGYRRRDSAGMVIVPAGESKPAEITGDEAALLARSGLGPVGIGEDRHAVGLQLLRDFAVDAFLLDDGFQHWRLSRDLDIVLIDALDPWAGGQFPLGRLREGYAALQRADAIVLTRTQSGRNYRRLIEEIRSHNPRAPIFRSRVAPVEWQLIGGDARMPAAGTGLPPVAAFCGLGNPGSFWMTLHALGITPLHRMAFPDHHRYRLRDLESIAAAARRAGAAALLTTAKDAMNMPPALCPDPPIWQLHVETEVENGQELAALAAGFSLKRARVPDRADGA
jgi:tetraacyldisaccharide 4'-kinase